MAGVLIASALQEAGIKTAVLEADRIAGGQSREHHGQNNGSARSYIPATHGRFWPGESRTVCPGKPAGGGDIPPTYT
ncbi:MAG: hypothetical protein V8T45_05025 [Oscillospiraceae bacterium]